MKFTSWVLREVARIHRDMETIMTKVGFQGRFEGVLQIHQGGPAVLLPHDAGGKSGVPETGQPDHRRHARAALDEFFITKPKASLLVKPVEPFREQGAAAAFYEQPAPDGSRPGVYYLNTVDMRGVPIFEMETLAHHEAIPGHHMQIAIAQENLTGLPKLSGGLAATPLMRTAGRCMRNIFPRNLDSTRIHIRTSAGSTTKSCAPCDWWSIPAFTRSTGHVNR